MPATLDPFAGAQQEGESQKKQLLDAIAQGGAAGKQAYLDAQKSVGTMRQGALDRAGQRARLTGQELGGADVAPVAETADRFGTYFSGQDAARQGLLDQIGASGTSYLSKVQAIAPFMQNQNIQAAADREGQIQAALKVAADKAAAEAAADEQAHRRQIELLGIKNRYDIDADARSNAAKAAAEKAPNITLNQLVGAAAQEPGILRDKGNILGQAVGGENIAAAGLLDRAGQIGTQAGVPGHKLAGLTEPGFKRGLIGDLSALSPGAAPVPQPPALDKNWLTSSFRYQGKQITSKRADEVARAPEVQQAQEFLPGLVNLKRDPASGRITDTKAADAILGKTPREAFNAWVDSVPGILTMKTALKDYYGPYLDQISKV